MTHAVPLQDQVIRVLARQGWVPVSEETPHLLRRGTSLSEGFRFVGRKHVEAFGVFPVQKTKHADFIMQNPMPIF